MGTESNKEKLTAGTVLKSILSGDILLLMRVDRLLPYILVLFALGWINIFLNYKIYHAQKTYQFVKMGRISTVEDMLEQGGSKLTAPAKPAETIIAD